MNATAVRHTFDPGPADAAGVLSWVHIGDLHMVAPGEQNNLDLGEIVNAINGRFHGSLSFVYVPGDVADDGSTAAYGVVREELDRLQTPWCAIIGDHDVHEKSFENFRHAMGHAGPDGETYYAFTAGKVRFVAMNAFDVAHPASFAVLPPQLQWLDSELAGADARGLQKVVLLHCYPSDLKQGGEAVSDLIEKYHVKLVDMGHTHYNEIANDGRTVYTATRSTGQVEEGPVGFSVTNIDGDAVSWRFFELGDDPAVMVTSPADSRLTLEGDACMTTHTSSVRVRVKVWSANSIRAVEAKLDGVWVSLHRIEGSQVWQGDIPVASSGAHGDSLELQVEAHDAEGKTGRDAIWLASDEEKELMRERQERDQDNALESWPEHGLLGTQLGPNKNGRKW